MSSSAPARFATAPAAPPARVSDRGDRRAGLLALAFYGVVSFLYFGRPLYRDLGSMALATDAIDSSAFQWFLAWWPHAISHGINPFVSHAIFTPEGFNIVWATSFPGPALVLAPVTALFGPTASFNLFALSAPPLTAWGGFALCRQVTGAVWPSVLGGFLFGFSPYILSSMTGAPHLSLVALVPVFALLVLRRVAGTLERRRFIALFVLAIVGQFLIFVEVLFTTAVFGAAALILGYLLWPERRRALRRTVGEMVIAGAISLVAVSPLLYFFLQPHTSPEQADPRVYRANLLDFVIPQGHLQLKGQWIADQWGRLGIDYHGSGANYLGLVLVGILVAFAVEFRRRRSARLVLGFGLVAAIASLGARLGIGDAQTIPLPWGAVVDLPLFKYALPVRFALYTSLAAALAVAMWLAWRPGIARWAIALVAVVMFLPQVSAPLWHSPAVDPPFFSAARYESRLYPGDNVLTVPTWGQNVRWQARDGFRWNLVGGYLGWFPDAYTRYPAWRTTITGRLGRDPAAELRDYVRAKRVSVVVVDKSTPGPWRRLFGTLGVPAEDVGGVLVYRLRRPA
jgi:hypothetical protein